MRAGASKYHAKPCVVDNIRFASQKEAKRYGELTLLEKAGEISGLILQPAYPLDTIRAGAGTLLQVGIYRADFAYSTRQGDVVEDVKGFKTPLYKWKKRHVEAQYGINIVEI